MKLRFSARAACGVLAFLLPAAGALAGVAEPDGYQLDNYRSEVPGTLKGAKVVTTAQAQALWEGKATVFIDVLPRPPKPNLPAGTVYKPKPRFAIPGSVWLVDTGYGALTPEMEKYFKDGLVRATDGKVEKPILFYCLSNCWMSWNAAKRAISLGYANVSWYPEGTDGWSAAGLPLVQHEPEPRPDDAPQ